MKCLLLVACAVLVWVCIVGLFAQFGLFHNLGVRALQVIVDLDPRGRIAFRIRQATHAARI